MKRVAFLWFSFLFLLNMLVFPGSFALSHWTYWFPFSFHVFFAWRQPGGQSGQPGPARSSQPGFSKTFCFFKAWQHFFLFKAWQWFGYFSIEHMCFPMVFISCLGGMNATTDLATLAAFTDLLAVSDQGCYVPWYSSTFDAVFLLFKEWRISCNTLK